jgi:signal transduction histidine kinase
VRKLAHDIASPIAAIRLYAADLRADGASPAHYAEIARRVEEAAARVLRVLGHVNAPAQLATPTVVDGSGTSGVDLYLVCCELAAERRRLDPHISIHCRASGDPRGTWEAAQIVTVVSQLLDDAASRAEQGTVMISVNEMAGYLRLTVQSVGARFDRGADAAGLDVALQAVTAMGGSMSVSRSEAVGTIVTVRLPRAARGTSPRARAAR